MFRFVTAIFLLIAFAAQTFSQAVIVLDYYANRTSFAKHCENKAIPRMHCNGKCQMMKKIKEQEKQEQQNQEQKLENKNEVVSSRSFFASLQFHEMVVNTSFNVSSKPAFPDGQPRDIFHPPALV